MYVCEYCGRCHEDLRHYYPDTEIKIERVRYQEAHYDICNICRKLFIIDDVVNSILIERAIVRGL